MQAISLVAFANAVQASPGNFVNVMKTISLPEKTPSLNVKTRLQPIRMSSAVAGGHAFVADVPAMLTTPKASFMGLFVNATTFLAFAPMALCAQAMVSVNVESANAFHHGLERIAVVQRPGINA